jgi:ATP-grasp domain, R2K clade family 2
MRYAYSPMPALILTPRQTDDAQALWRAAIARGWDVHRLTTWRVPEELQSVLEPILYVEALFGPSLAEQLGVRLLDPPEDWLPRLPIVYRRRAVSLTTFGHARRLDAAAFVKPPNDKSFPAAVYAPAELSAAFDDAMLVLVAEPVRFLSEFRCFILDRTIRTFSIYCRDGDLQRADDSRATPDEEQQLAGFVGSILADSTVELPRACALDVGLIEDRGWAVVELNAAWGAGIYGCDPDRVLDVIRFATVPLADASVR